MSGVDGDLVVCPVCGALTANGAALDHHLYWHDTTNTMGNWTADDARRRVGQIARYQQRRP